MPAHEEMPQPVGTIRVLRRITYFFVVPLLFGLALFKFAYQDVLQLSYPVNDLTSPWVASQAFLQGINPYGNAPDLEKIWATRAQASADYPDYNSVLLDYPMAYPPTALALIAPLELLAWDTAVYAYLAGSAALFVLALLLLAHKLLLPWNDPRKLCFVAFALAMAPLHSGIHEVNLNTVIVANLCIGVALMSLRPTWSGIAIAVAVCLKPQVGMFFFAYPWIRRKWKPAFTALAACTFISVGSMLWMSVHHVEWFKAFRNEIALTATRGVDGSLGGGASKFQMIDLQLLTFQLTHSRKWSAIFAWLIFLLLAGTAINLIHRRVSDRNESAGIATVAILTLLPVYQRFYTADVLLFVLYWALENFDLPRAKTALLLMVPLLVPFAAWTERTGLAMRFMESSHSALRVFWTDFLLPHVIWIELALLLILIADLSARTECLVSVPASEVHHERDIA